MESIEHVTQRLFRPPLRRLVEHFLDGREGLGAGGQMLVLAVALLAIFSRSPGLLMHAQFYAEDGTVWYQEAYNSGWLHTLFWPHAGYLCLLERMGVGLAMLMPLRDAPLLLAWLGMFCQLLPIGILLSARCRAFASLRMRCLWAAAYVAMPNAAEVQINWTNAMWHVMLAGVLLAFATPPRSWAGRVSDSVLFVCFALTGPFAILMTPLLLAYWWLRRQGWTLWLTGIVGVGAVMQLVALWHARGARPTLPLGATPARFLRIVGGDVFAGSIMGRIPVAVYAPFLVLLVFFVFGVWLYVYGFRALGLPMKMLILYGAGLLLAEMRSPVVAGPKTLWDALIVAKTSRYWFLPGLTFLWLLIWCAMEDRGGCLRLASRYLLGLLVVCELVSWRMKPFPDRSFLVSVRQFEAARPGQVVSIPIVPVPREMDLVKHGR